MIYVNVIAGPHKGRRGYVVDFAIEPGNDDFETWHWLLLDLDGEPCLDSVRLDHVKRAGKDD